MTTFYLVLIRGNGQRIMTQGSSKEMVEYISKLTCDTTIENPERIISIFMVEAPSQTEEVVVDN